MPQMTTSHNLTDKLKELVPKYLRIDRDSFIAEMDKQYTLAPHEKEKINEIVTMFIDYITQRLTSPQK